MSNNNNDNLSKHVLISILLHVCVLLVFTVKAILLPDESLEYIPAMRVDLVALPDKNPPPPSDSKKNQPPPAPKVEEKKLPPVVENSTAAIAKQALKKEEPKIPDGPTVALKKDDKKAKTEKTESAIAKLRSSMAVDKIKQLMKETEPEPGSQQVYKGNELSAGTELTGLNKLQHETYIADLDRHVKKFWALPDWLSHKSYTAQIRIYLDEKGLLINAKLVKSSGLREYDESVMDSIQKASPYPTPPPKFKNIVSVAGILLGFPE